MAPSPPTYAIGDLQGCLAPLHELVGRLPPEAELRFVGDLVNRGPDSLGTLRAVRGFGRRARALLGNHDIHLMAVAAGVRKKGRSDTVDDILNAPDLDELLTWLRHRPLALREGDFLLVHAGLLPQWTANQAMDLALEIEEQLQGGNWQAFLADIFGNAADRWDDRLRGVERHRAVVNALTRLRFCTAEGVMDLKLKEGPDAAPEGFMPWFDVPGRRSADVTVVAGHWSTMGLVTRPNLMLLDTGCVWGGQLTAARLDRDPAGRTLTQVKCPQFQDPTA